MKLGHVSPPSLHGFIIDRDIVAMEEIIEIIGYYMKH